jgi:hypothetical protein
MKVKEGQFGKRKAPVGGVGRQERVMGVNTIKV